MTRPAPARDPVSRRKWLLSAAAAGGLTLLHQQTIWAQGGPANRIQLKTPPVWTGFGLNGSARDARFDLTRGLVLRKTGKGDLSHPDAFGWLRAPLRKLLAAQDPPVVSFKTEVAFGQSVLAGFAHDYEIAVGARVEKDGDNANTLFIFMSGVGLILAFVPASGWRITSSFPFILRFERPGGDLRDVRGKALGLMEEAYTGYCAAYAHFMSRFGRWDRGFSSNYFARVTKASIHPDAAKKLTKLGADRFFSRELIGFSSSAAICDNLGIPLLPFQENDALAKRYATIFTDSIVAQNVLEIPDADIRFEVIVRDVEKQLIPSRQRGLTIIRRQLVINFRVLSEDALPGDKPFLQTIAVSAPDDDKMPYQSTEDDTPERDMVFFDRLLTRTLTILLQGIAKKDATLLAQVGVSFERIGPAIPRLLEICAKTV